MLKVALQRLFSTAHRSRRATTLAGVSAGATWGTGRQYSLWRTCLLIYSIPSPTTHFSLQIIMFDHKNMTRMFWGSFYMTFFLVQSEGNTWDTLSSSSPITTAALSHGSWWIFLSLGDSSSCGLKNKPPNTVRLTIKLPDLAALPYPFGPFPFREAPHWNHTMQGPLWVCY